MSTIPRLPYDITSHIRAMTCDPSWAEYPPPIVGYHGSPLATAMNISHVCKEWRTEVLDDAALWGRLLNTIYYPTSNHSLWNMVYDRVGDAPIWLRYIDVTVPNEQDFSQRDRQKMMFMRKFLKTLEDTAPDRIQRLEISISHGDELWEISDALKQKISEIVARHATHLTLGNAYLARALALPQISHDPVRREWAIGLSEHLLSIIFGNGLDTGGTRPLKELRMHSMAVGVGWLLEILRTSPDLEEFDLCIGTQPDYGSWQQAMGTWIDLPRLRVCNIRSLPRMVVEADDSSFSILHAMSFAHRFDIAGKFKTYHFRCKGGIYEVERIEGAASKVHTGVSQWKYGPSMYVPE